MAAAKSDVGIVVVHGIGEQLAGQTLLEWAEPLVSRLDLVSRHKGWTGAQVRHASLVEADAEVVVAVDVGAETPRTVRVTEARWAASFLTQKPTSIIWWAVRSLLTAFARLLTHLRNVFLPMFGDGLASPMRRLRVWAFENIPSGATRGLVRAVLRVTGFLAGVVVLAVILLPLLALTLVLWIVPLIAVVVLFALVVLVRLPVIGKWVRPAVTAITTLFGDATIFRASRVTSAVMRDVVRGRLRDAGARAKEVVLVGHSQGAAIGAWSILSDDFLDEVRVTGLVTIGGATRLLSPAGAAESSYDPVGEWARRPKLHWVNIWAMFDPVSSGPVVMKGASLGQRWRELRGSHWASFAFSGDLRDERLALARKAGHEESEFIIPPYGIDSLWHGIFEAMKDGRWIATTPGPVGPEEHAIRNRNSFLTDHTTYSSNSTQVIDPIARLALGAALEGDDLFGNDYTWNVVVRDVTLSRLVSAVIAIVVNPAVVAWLVGLGLRDTALDAFSAVESVPGVVLQIFQQNNWLVAGIFALSALTLTYLVLRIPSTLVFIKYRAAAHSLDGAGLVGWLALYGFLNVLGMVFAMVWLDGRGIDDVVVSYFFIAFAIQGLVIFWPGSTSWAPARRSADGDPTAWDRGAVIGQWRDIAGARATETTEK
jgi:hypothetical protein